MYPSNFRCLIAAGAHTVADLVAEGLVMLAAADNDAENATIHVAVMRTGERDQNFYLIPVSLPICCNCILRFHILQGSLVFQCAQSDVG